MKMKQRLLTVCCLSNEQNYRNRQISAVDLDHKLKPFHDTKMYTLIQ